MCGISDYSRRKAILAAGKLDLGFGLGGSAITHRGAITPRPYGVKNGAVFYWACALQNEWRIHVAIDADDETDLRARVRSNNVKQRIGRGQRLGGRRGLATRLYSGAERGG